MAQTTQIDRQLEKLITCCEDAYHGYMEASKAVTSPELRRKFEENARLRMEWRSELNRFNPGLDHKKEGSMAGKVYRAWINFKEKLKVSDEEICADCVVGEKQAIDQYEEVLADESLDPEFRSAVQRQHGELVTNLEWLKARAV